MTARLPEVGMLGLADAFGLSFELVEPLLEIHRRAAQRDNKQADRLVVGDGFRGPVADDVLDGERPGASRLVDFQGEQVVDSTHNSSPSFVDADTPSVGERPAPVAPNSGAGQPDGGAL